MTSRARPIPEAHDRATPYLCVRDAASADEFPEMGFRGPLSLGGSSVTIHLYVEDVDAVARQAVAAGARMLRPVQDQFYGDRSGTLTDPFGHVWMVATHKEDVSVEEMQKRFAALYA